MGHRVRAFCPFHRSDHQRSLAIDKGTGRFCCFACGAWGYMDWARTNETRNRFRVSSRRKVGSSQTCEPRGDLLRILENYQNALPGSVGQKYLEFRGIVLPLAQKHALGYAAPGKWIHEGRDWKWGRIVVPHTTPSGQVVNLYGRAVGSDEKVPKELRHDHLPGAKGYFNGTTLRNQEPLFVTEGPFDALSLMAAGCPCAVAIFGTRGWRADWANNASKIVLALDADSSGQLGWREIARQSRLRGKTVAYLPPEVYGGRKDANEAWTAGILTLPLTTTAVGTRRQWRTGEQEGCVRALQ